MAPPMRTRACLLACLFATGQAKVTCPVITVQPEPCEPCEAVSGGGSSTATCAQGPGSEDAIAKLQKQKGRLSQHLAMMQDEHRTNAYRTAIFANAEEMEGKVAIDVGAGVGMLSFFAAQAGFGEVHAVESTDTALTARKIAASANNAEWGAKVHVHHGDVEDLKLAPGSADAIIASGFGTLFFNDIPSLTAYLKARDRFLKPDGLMFPEEATLFLAPFSNAANYKSRSEKYVEFYAQDSNDPLSYGVDWKAALPEARRQSLAMPVVSTLQPEHFVARPNKFPGDLRNLQPSSLESIKLPLDFEVNPNSGTEEPETVTVSGLVGWFELEFPKGTKLSTAPWAERTHWKQVHMLLKVPLSAEVGEHLKGDFRISADKSGTHCNVQFKLCVGASAVVCSESELIDLSDAYQPFEATPEKPKRDRSHIKYGRPPVEGTDTATTTEYVPWKLPSWIKSRQGWVSKKYNK